MLKKNNEGRENVLRATALSLLFSLLLLLLLRAHLFFFLFDSQAYKRPSFSVSCFIVITESVKRWEEVWAMRACVFGWVGGQF
jgi:hypothetical protein